MTGAPPPYQGPPPPYPPQHKFPGSPNRYPPPPPGGYQTGAYPPYPPSKQPSYQSGPYPAYPPADGPHVVSVVHQPVRTVIIQERRINHLLHFLIFLLFPPWIFVWVALCITY